MIDFAQKADRLYLLTGSKVKKLLLPSFTETDYDGQFTRICMLEEPIFIKDSSSAFKLAGQTFEQVDFDQKWRFRYVEQMDNNQNIIGLNDNKVFLNGEQAWCGMSDLDKAKPSVVGNVVMCVDSDGGFLTFGFQ